MKIGIYLIDDVWKDPEDREYEQWALYDTEEGAWDEKTDGRVLFREPEEKTLETLTDRFASDGKPVLKPEDVPGEIVVPDEPDVTLEDAREQIEKRDMDVPVDSEP